MPPSSRPADPAVIRRALRFIGAPDDSIVVLDPTAGVTGENADYADLLRAELGQAVGAVIEKDGSPVIYIADLRSSNDDGEQLARLLGNRGETAALVAIGHSDGDSLSAKAWPCSLDPPDGLDLDLAKPMDARAVLADLQTGLWLRTDWKYGYQEESLRDLLVSSVTKVSREFTAAAKIKPKDPRSHEVLALIGRALFTRFLLDRQILSQDTAPRLWETLGGDGANAFESPIRATVTCEWLDHVFNGEFLPLRGGSSYLDYFTELHTSAPGALVALGWILHRTNHDGLLPLWDRLDFSYIPAGTLSEVYEHYAHSLNKTDAAATSIHFTPRHLARMMVRQALGGLEPSGAPDARLLDPAVGAGVFLSIGLREIVKRKAVRDQTWPSTADLRSILYRQIRGMDINGAALNLAALTLYLTVVELDADPLPPEKLKFDVPLLGSVLFDVSEEKDGPALARLGSLNGACPAGTDFDLVIGNPPWTSPPNATKAYTAAIEAAARATIERRGAPEQRKYQHPDNVPDIAFFWRSSGWLREGGVLALILHQRFLIKRSSRWSGARQALMSCFKFHGIVNAGQFADHHQLIWPGIESPFCIVFATNEAAPPLHRFQMLNLELEPSMRKRRQLRIDPGAVFSVAPAEFEERPGAMIVRTKGCELDRQLLLRWQDRIDFHSRPIEPSPARANSHAEPNGNSPNLAFKTRVAVPVKPRTSVRSGPLITIKAFMRTFSDGEPRRGIKTGDKGAKTPDWFNEVPSDAREYCGTEAHVLVGHVDAEEITTRFSSRPVKSTHPLRHFTPPLLLMKEAPGERFEPSRATLITSSGPAVAYSFSYIGVPVASNEDALLRAKYLAIWLNSSVVSYFTTLTSTRFGFGRKVVNNDELLECPIVDLQVALAAETVTIESIEATFDLLKRPDVETLRLVDELVARVIGLDAEERQLIEDTLSISYPIGESRQSGKSWVRPTQYSTFVQQLRVELEDDDDVIKPDSVQEITTGPSLSGWRFFRWQAALPSDDAPTESSLLDASDDRLLELTKRSYPSGQVFSVTPDGKQGVFGQLALARLWLPSRAPLIAQTLIAKMEALQA